MKIIAISQFRSHRIPGAIVTSSAIVASNEIVVSSAITAFPAKAISVEYVQ